MKVLCVTYQNQYLQDDLTFNRNAFLKLQEGAVNALVFLNW